MNKYPIVFAVMLPFLVIFGRAYSQPILTSATSNPVIGDVFYKYDCIAAGVSTGSGGAGVIWNFSSLVDTATDTSYIVSCLSTPYCDSFPGGSIVQVQRGVEFSMNKTHYQAITANTTVLEYTNWATFYSGYGVEIGYADKPGGFNYPVSYTDNWHDTTLLSAPFNAQRTFMSNYVAVDGYGTLILPSGSYSALRIHILGYITDTLFKSGIQTRRNEAYIWYTPGIHQPLLTIGIDTAHGVPYTSAVQMGTAAPLSVKNVVSPEIPIVNIYPQPAKSFISTPSAPQNCNSIVYDLTGRVVITESALDAGQRIDVSSLPAGTYLLLLRNRETRTVIGKAIFQKN